MPRISSIFRWTSAVLLALPLDPSSSQRWILLPRWGSAIYDPAPRTCTLVSIYSNNFQLGVYLVLAGVNMFYLLWDGFWAQSHSFQSKNGCISLAMSGQSPPQHWHTQIQIPFLQVSIATNLNVWWPSRYLHELFTLWSSRQAQVNVVSWRFVLRGSWFLQVDFCEHRGYTNLRML